MKTKEFEDYLVECEKNKFFTSLLEPLMSLTDEDRMYMMKKLDNMNKEPKKITIFESYKSHLW